MIEPYENISIGNFLYSLGLHIGKGMGNKTIPGVINLLQQTPADKTLSDVMLNFPGVVRLIEFKRTSNKSDKEKIKCALINEEIQYQDELKGISEEIHWYVESKTTPQGFLWNYSVFPYIKYEQCCESSAANPAAFNGFLDNIVSEVLAEKSLNRQKLDLIKIYLNVLSSMSEKQSTSSGMIVCASKEKGIQYIPVSDFRVLDLELSKFIEYENTLGAQYQRAKELALDHMLERAIENQKEKERGYDMDR